MLVLTFCFQPLGLGAPDIYWYELRGGRAGATPLV